MLFQLQKAPIYRAVIFRKSFYPDTIRLVRTVLLTIGGLALFAFILSHRFVFNIPVAPTAQDVPILQETQEVQGKEYTQYGGQQVVIDLGANLFLKDRTWQGLAYIFLPMGFFLIFFEIFYKFYLKYPKLRRSENVAEFLSFDMAMIFDDAFVLSRRSGEDELSIDALLWAFTQYAPARILFYRMGIEPEAVKENLVHITTDLKNKMTSAIKFSFKRETKLSASVESAIVDAAELRNNHKHERISMSDFFAAFFDTHEDFQKLVVNLELDKNDLIALSRWREHDRQEREKKRRFWAPENLLHSRPIGVGWVYGYPSLLDKFSNDMTLPFRERVADMRLIGREKILKRMQETLIRGEK
ncbi:MAG: hypothetical protein R3251_04685, partial [Candidatus Spechtbacterales bacterium]|nr:hypothetical protein [Candidatus Spechtbacterales bacterium]